MEKRCLGCMETYGEEFGVCPHCGYVEGTPPEEAVHMAPGAFLADRYLVGRVLGYGGFGVTYIGWDGKLEQKVAIKEYLPSEFSTRMPGSSTVTVFGGDKEQQYADGLAKFVDEAKRLAKFQNEPGIVKVFDAFEENGTAYIVMELLEGETLTERLRREGTIPEDEAVAMMLPLMQSLQAVHAEGILHRDIAPDNVFITAGGEVKLIDFGASRYATTSHSRSLTVIVKPGYSPEEQYRSRGDQGPHTDVYALGATLYKMVTGKTPPDAMERRAKVESSGRDPLQRPRSIDRSISDAVEVAIMNAVNVRVEDRTPDVPGLISELTSPAPAPRRGSALKRVDLYTWPLWFKVAAGAVGAAVVVLAVLLATGVIGFQSLFSDASIVPEGYVEVPSVEGRDKDAAVKLIQERGLSASAEGNVESEFQAAGVIVLQSPNGGTYVEKGSTVGLTVSGGTGVKAAEEGVATVPYVVWDTQDDAVAKLLQAGLGSPSVVQAYSTSVAAGRVMAQSEPYGSQVPEGYSITITVSLGAGSQAPPESGGGQEKEKTLVISDWVAESQVPSGAEVIASYYTYDYTEKTSSQSPSMSGWTRYDQSTSWSSWGSWSGWSYDAYYASDSRQVESQTVVDSYTMETYVFSDGSSPNGRGYSPTNPGNVRAHYGPEVWPASTVWSLAQVSGWYNGPSNVAGQVHGTGYISQPNQIPFFVVGTNYATQYRYRDRYQITTYYYTRTSHLQSSDYPSGGNISNVQKWVQYQQWV